MKKTLLVVAALGITYAGIAQDKYVTSALTALSTNSLDEAKADIDRAIANPETKEKPKALFAKGKIYLKLAETNKNDKPKAIGYFNEASQALIRLAEVKPEYEKDEVNGYFYYSTIIYYNGGINAYNEKRYEESANMLKTVVKIHDLNGGKRFEKFPMGKNMDTISANAQVQIVRCSYAQNKYEDVIAQLSALIKSNPAGMGKTKDNYIILLESYDKYNAANANKMVNEQLAAITEARAAFPNDPNIRNMEMNTLMASGKTGDLMKKMEDDVAKDPNNADLNFNLGILYQTLANPKDGKKPANAAELWSKAEEKVTRATKLSPENAAYSSALGTLYYQQGYDLNDQMNAITGSSAADMKKYNDLKAKRDAIFTKSLEPYEKAISIYAAREKKSITGNDYDIYHSTLSGYKQVCTVLNKADKAADAGTKLKDLDGN